MKMYFFMDANMQRRGPYALQVLVTFIAPHTLVWTEGMAQWAPAGTIPEIAKALGISSHPSHPPFVNHEGPYVGGTTDAPHVSNPVQSPKKGLHPAVWALVVILVLVIAALIGLLVIKDGSQKPEISTIADTKVTTKDTVVVTKTVPVMVPVANVSPVLIRATISDPDGWTNVRSGPSTSHQIVGKVFEGDVIYYQVVKGSNWYKIFDSDKCYWGYLHKSRLVRL